jgi:hypothetical protein
VGTKVCWLETEGYERQQTKQDNFLFHSFSDPRFTCVLKINYCLGVASHYRFVSTEQNPFSKNYKHSWGDEYLESRLLN